MIMVMITEVTNEQNMNIYLNADRGWENTLCSQSLRFFNVYIRVKEVFCFPLLFCLCEEKNFWGSSTKLAASQTGTNICRRNQLLSSVWTLNSLKWNIAFTEPFFIAVTVPKLLVITLARRFWWSFAQRQKSYLSIVVLVEKLLANWQSDGN